MTLRAGRSLALLAVVLMVSAPLAYLACGSSDGSSGEVSVDAADADAPLDASIDGYRPGLSDCGRAEPVDLVYDPVNCAYCNAVCGPGMECDQTRCVAALNLTDCRDGGDPAACEANDPRRCTTASGSSCDSNSYCTDKGCVPSANLDTSPECQPATHRCAETNTASNGGQTGVGGCYKLDTALNCGACGKQCAAGEGCVKGTCVAFTPSLYCTGICIPNAPCCPTGTVCCSNPSASGNQVMCYKGTVCPP